MVGDVEAEHLALERQPRAPVPLLHLRHVRVQGRALRLVAVDVEPEVEAVLAVLRVALDVDDRVDGGLEDAHQRAAGVTELVEGTGLDQRLDDALVAHQQRRLVEEIAEVGGRAEPVALVDPGVDHLVADVAHGAEAEADVVPDGRERHVGRVDVGRQHLDAHVTALGEVERRLVLVVAHRLQQRRHVLDGVVGLQPGRPVGDEAVGGGVGLVEGVVGEGKQDVPQGLDRPLRVAPLQHPAGEDLVLGVQLGLLLLAHGPAQHVGAAEGVAGQLLSDGHDLLLVHDQAVGLPQDRLQRLREVRMDGLDGFASGLTARVLVVRVRAHRAGAVERADGGDVLEAVGLHRAQQRPHRSAVELEHAQRVAALQQLERLGVVEGQGLQVDVDALVQLDALHRVVDHREVTQP